MSRVCAWILLLVFRLRVVPRGCVLKFRSHGRRRVDFSLEVGRRCPCEAVRRSSGRPEGVASISVGVRRFSRRGTSCNFLSFGKMGQKKDLTGSEKSKIVRYLAEGSSTLKIAKLLKRDHRTIKRFIQNSQQGRKKRVEKPRRKITAHELRKVKRAAATMPLATSLAIFQSCNITGVPKSTRCAILRDMAKVRKAERRPPLNKTHKLKRQDWANKYLKTDFSKVLWTDEMRVSLDGPDGWARGWIGKGQRAPVRLRRQQGGGGVLVWAGIIKDELVGPFRVEDGVKLNSQSYCQFLEDTFFKQWYRKKSASFKKNMIFMQDNAPSHASKYSTAWLARKGIKEGNLMTWPPCSPDLNPIENLWSIIKCEIYKEGKQYTSLNSVWEAVVAAARNVDGEQIKTLTESMDGRLLSVLAKKGGYIGHGFLFVLFLNVRNVYL
ncbi:hypothetical protein NDU88_004763 [Pleurodeles waltl]|uniref:Tc1-like transposase DDE domain-containing protein n=1 Tax=Pleurodeles waltl TaxID=8319 RepID=A0AAV7TUK7_PLEWA|nr:hypothetical protein NDU88_004763 [Pleurodeles waltl]